MAVPLAVVALSKMEILKPALGDFTGWTAGNLGSITIVSDTIDGRTGIFGRLQTTGTIQDVLLSQVGLTIAAGDTINASFDLQGAVADGGVVFVELIYQ